ncbi:kinase domain protein [Aspergillus costaricaensis CBS 115574]|uniref:Kinase domain protein n=1 Tax=Aspergillus costaricaensis CBS 115574 TaxID=1448317 RepID=A0ACD1INM0_9EURO|nr:kinase domain protein [Aspergillus costaricaensis CBS 115574]RAK91960.1 kinase domain protein [Aspergillus costaricaensis CBS 115574]
MTQKYISTIRSAFATKPVEPLEEEKLPFYKPGQFYPVHIGELLNSRYRVVGKLGYGSYSTVWLCHEKSEQTYVAVKILTKNASSRILSGELRIYDHLSMLKSFHIGGSYIRGLHDTFDITTPDGRYPCLVHPPMHMSLHDLRMLSSSRKLGEFLLKETLKCILQALDFLHTEANVVHTDIKPSNIMLSIDDPSILTDFEISEQQTPAPKKTIDSTRSIYTSRKLSLPKDMLWGQPVLCDLGQARIGPSHTGIIQPNIYKAPEVLFDMEWGFSVDIWNLGVMIWDIFEEKHLFNTLDEDGDYSLSHHVAEMVGFLGLPPLAFIERSRETRNVFTDDGKWLGAGGVTIPTTSLEETEENLGGKNQELFLQMIRG